VREREGLPLDWNRTYQVDDDEGRRSGRWPLDLIQAYQGKAAKVTEDSSVGMRQDGGRSSTTWRPNPDLAQSFTECHVGVGAAAGRLMVWRTAIAAQSRETGDGGVQELGWGSRKWIL
jgi:hypothetical protein